MYDKVGALGKEARWNEGCLCHEPALKTGKHVNCPRKGKRSVENAMGRIDIAIAAIKEVSSAKKVALLAAVPADERSMCIQTEHNFNEHLCEMLASSFQFYSHYPWRFMRARL